MKKTIYLTLTGAFLMGVAVGLLGSCGPSKEEIEKKKAQANTRYEIGNVVYLKPDSCAALIIGTNVSFNYNGVTDYNNAGYVVYRVRDCHGLEVVTKDQFIYGLKHK